MPPRVSKKSAPAAAAAAVVDTAPAPAVAQGSAQKRSTKNPDGSKKVVKHRPGTNTLNQIRKLQSNSNPIIPLKPFSDNLRSICAQIMAENGETTQMRWKPESKVLLRDDASDVMVKLFRDSGRISRHSGVVTVEAKDIWQVEDVTRPAYWKTFIHKREAERLLSAKNKKAKLGKKGKKSTKKSSKKESAAPVAAASVATQ